ALPGDEPPRRTVTHLPKEVGPYRRVIGPGDLVPDLAVRYAEVRPGTEHLRVGQVVCGALQNLRLAAVGLSARGLGAIETNFLVGAIAEGLGPRMAAAAERVARPGREGLTLA